MFEFLRGYRKTEFGAGGLVIDACDPLCAPRLGSGTMIFPKRRDERDLCQRSDSQGTTSKCAAYAMAGFCEVAHWVKTGTCKVFDPDPIYVECKKKDGLPEASGTTLQAVCQAALDMKLLPWKTGYRLVYSIAEYKRAIVEYRCCLLGMRIRANWNRVGRNGVIPDGATDGNLGGHCTLGNYYDLTMGPGGQNSWDATWGLHGHYTMSWNEFEREFFMGAVLV
jgi:hypothetical protein